MNFETEPDESGDELHPYDEPFNDEDDNDDDDTGYIEPLTHHQGESDDTGYLEPDPITDQGEIDDGTGDFEPLRDENETGYEEPLGVQEVSILMTGAMFYVLWMMFKTSQPLSTNNHNKNHNNVSAVGEKWAKMATPAILISYHFVRTF